MAEEQTVWDIWRKESYPRNIVLLDNDFFGQPNWRRRIEEIRAVIHSRKPPSFLILPAAVSPWS